MEFRRQADLRYVDKECLLRKLQTSLFGNIW